MHIDDLEYFMDIARTFNNVPKNGNGLELCRFEELPPGVEARHVTDGQFQYVIINSSFNKSNYQLSELGYIMGIFVHEYRHVWQENYDPTGYFLVLRKVKFSKYAFSNSSLLNRMRGDFILFYFSFIRECFTL